MRIRSFRRMGDSAFKTLRRFPLVIATSIVAAVSCIILTNETSMSQDLLRLVLSAQLGIPLLLAVGLANERFSPEAASVRNGLLLSLAGVIVLVIHYFSLSNPIGDGEQIRFGQWNIAAHLMVAFLPYLRSREFNGFWHYNLALALRMLVAIFFTIVLFAGLSLALFALETLLNIEMDEKIYLHLWISLVFVFNTWYFLGGVPSDWRELEASESFPKIVQVFGQYILSPLVIVYQLILTAYLVKIIITTVWPSSWIGWLVSGVAVAGLLSLLLIHPRTESGASRWARIYGRVFHIALIPAVVMLLMAVGQRIGQYGVTEMRYLLAVLAVWLGVMAILGSIRGRISIRTIPITLFLVAVLTTIGPLSASSISRRSQLARLDSLLTGYDRLIDGVIIPDESVVPNEDAREVTAALRYLFQYHGPDVLGDRCDEALQAKLDKSEEGNESRLGRQNRMSRIVTAHANVAHIYSRSASSNQYMVFRNEAPECATEIRNYDFGVAFVLDRKMTCTVEFEGREYRFALEAESASVVLTRDADEILTIDLAPLVSDLIVNYQSTGSEATPAELMEIEVQGDMLGVKLAFSQVTLFGEEKKEQITNLDAMAYVRLPAQQIETTPEE